MESYVAVAGEALIDLVPDTTTGSFRAVPGGSPANVAVGLARLGCRTQLLGRIAASGFGPQIREHVAGNGVGLDLAVSTSDPATLAVVSLDAAGAASYDFYATGTADFGWTDADLPARLPDGVQALCTGSIAVFREPGAAALHRLLVRERETGRSTIVMDPNIRASLIGEQQTVAARWRELIALADVVKASDEDIAWLHPGADPEDVLADWVSAGPAVAVVTRGGAGAVAITAAGARISVPAVPTTVVDTVGAGDSFTAGLVDSLRRHDLLGGDRTAHLAAASDDVLTTVLERAARIAAITCGRQGADPPTHREVDQAS
ncbi:carbohydrate kinase family protein [Nocardioides limicola]|uniref:carbohydrate kinase family protein n=1 Tax=Nocardioides limicola TaxID=2803368 RepID=UPI00193BDE02|nr:carbohydrate kinase [Nocardioides sp. DJM-14]